MQEIEEKDSPLSLLDLSASKVAKTQDADVIANHPLARADHLYKLVLFWSFPQDSSWLELLTLEDRRTDSYHRDANDLIDKILEIFQIGFYLCARVPRYRSSSGEYVVQVKVEFEKQKPTAYSCSNCGSNICEHIIAVIRYRMEFATQVLIFLPFTNVLDNLNMEELKTTLKLIVGKHPAMMLRKVCDIIRNLDGREENDYVDPTVPQIKATAEQLPCSVFDILKSFNKNAWSVKSYNGDKGHRLYAYVKKLYCVASVCNVRTANYFAMRMMKAASEARKTNFSVFVKDVVNTLTNINLCAEEEDMIIVKKIYDFIAREYDYHHCKHKPSLELPKISTQFKGHIREVISDLDIHDEDPLLELTTALFVRSKHVKSPESLSIMMRRAEWMVNNPAVKENDVKKLECLEQLKEILLGLMKHVQNYSMLYNWMMSKRDFTDEQNTIIQRLKKIWDVYKSNKGKGKKKRLKRRTSLDRLHTATKRRRLSIYTAKSLSEENGNKGCQENNTHSSMKVAKCSPSIIVSYVPEVLYRENISIYFAQTLKHVQTLESELWDFELYQIATFICVEMMRFHPIYAEGKKSCFTSEEHTIFKDLFKPVINFIKANKNAFHPIWSLSKSAVHELEIGYFGDKLPLDLINIMLDIATPKIATDRSSESDEDMEMCVLFIQIIAARTNDTEDVNKSIKSAYDTLLKNWIRLLNVDIQCHCEMTKQILESLSVSHNVPFMEELSGGKLRNLTEKFDHNLDVTAEILEYLVHAAAITNFCDQNIARTILKSLEIEGLKQIEGRWDKLLGRRNFQEVLMNISEPYRKNKESKEFPVVLQNCIVEMYTIDEKGTFYESWELLFMFTLDDSKFMTILSHISTNISSITKSSREVLIETFMEKSNGMLCDEIWKFVHDSFEKGTTNDCHIQLAVLLIRNSPEADKPSRLLRIIEMMFERKSLTPEVYLELFSKITLSTKILPQKTQRKLTRFVQVWFKEHFLEMCNKAKRDNQYRKAVDEIRNIGRKFWEISKKDLFKDTINQLKTEFKRKKNLVKLLDELPDKMS